MTAAPHAILRRALVALTLILLGTPGLAAPAGHAQTPSLTFPETGKTVSGRFLQYWANHGGTPVQGLPISEEMPERSATDGQTYTVQYFERAVFEYHPENAPPYDVLLALLGVQAYQQKYPEGAPDQAPNTMPGARLFPETGKHVGCQFLDYWERHGGLAQFGYPISEEFDEVSDLDSQTHRVQYFERAVFEWHGENDARQAVLLAQLGTVRQRAWYGGATPGGSATPSGCAATPHGPSYSDPWPDPPLRASVGQGHVLQGTIRTSRDCAPLPGARIAFVLAGPDGQYDDDHTGTALADSTGHYRFTSNYPAFYGAGGPHIHLYVSAAGHHRIELEYFVYCNTTSSTFDIVLAPQTP